MSTNKPFDELVSTFLPGTMAASGDLGIEIELEGSLNPQEVGTGRLWNWKGENSLRNGIEFVLRKPIPIGHLSEALKQLDYTLSKSKPKTSIRCSTHMHINIQKMKVREVFSAAFAYFLIEESLLALQTNVRRGNLFCLRMSDAEEVAATIMASLDRGDFLGAFNYDRYKYGAINLAAMTKFGSLEFRFMDAMYDANGLDTWATLLYHLVHNGSKLSPKELLARYDALPVNDFLAELLGKRSASLLTKSLTSVELNRLLHTNYDILTDLARVFEARKKFEMPEAFWYEDKESPKKVHVRGRPRSKASAYASQFNLNPGYVVYDDVASMQQWYDSHMATEQVPTPATTTNATATPTGIDWGHLDVDDNF